MGRTILGIVSVEHGITLQCLEGYGLRTDFSEGLL